jgi:hypothetical protein
MKKPFDMKTDLFVIKIDPKRVNLSTNLYKYWGKLKETPNKPRLMN